ncbi:MAG: hypothetical protein AAGF58_17420 [Pseudomonadota bacterium]
MSITWTNSLSNTREIPFPKVNASTAWTVLLAGAMATVAFDLFGQSLSPMAGFSKLTPVGLANGVIAAVFGSGYQPGAYLLHLLAGLIAYPVGWLFIARPIAQRVTPFLHWSVTSAVYGVGLWIFALYFMAHLVAGNAPFLGFSQIAWVALVGHILFAMVAAWVVAWREETALA